jgi:hypothetical protein
MNVMKTLFRGFNFKKLSLYSRRIAGDGNGDGKKHNRTA